MGLDRITFAHFRNHQATRLDGTAQFNLLVGENGAGKTNVLEAISLLAPGRGLRRAGEVDACAEARRRLLQFIGKQMRREDSDGIATLLLDRPEAYNALFRAMLACWAAGGGDDAADGGDAGELRAAAGAVLALGAGGRMAALARALAAGGGGADQDALFLLLPGAAGVADAR